MSCAVSFQPGQGLALRRQVEAQRGRGGCLAGVGQQRVRRAQTAAGGFDPGPWSTTVRTAGRRWGGVQGQRMEALEQAVGARDGAWHWR